MTEFFPAFRPSELENDAADMSRRAKTVLTRAGLLVEFRPHRVTVERFASIKPGRGYAVSTVDVAEVTERDSGPAHVVLFDTGDRFAVANFVGAVAQLRGRLDHGRWLWTTRATRTRSNGSRVITLAVRDEDQAAARGPLAPLEREWAVRHPKASIVPQSAWAALYTLVHLPGAVLITRGPGEVEWVPEVACVCGDRGREPNGTGHYQGCPEQRRPDCPGDAEVILETLTPSAGYLASCDHCQWQGTIRGLRVDAVLDRDAHNAAADECDGGSDG
ncbi:hypothetical protein [Saccharothrix lopnurensis]|uniref:Uncharacterized protein n=1 Tax=Saccharothrix lopnurensis TaxID=1670621 RepID=A0ABW1P6Y2_9PSEU